MSTLFEVEQAAKQLSAAEQAILIRNLRRVSSPGLAKEAADGSGRIEADLVVWPDVEARARAIFGDKVIPNMVLEDRQSEDR
jgi:hypothetical protein